MMEASQPKKARIINFSLCVIFQNNVKTDKARTITKPGHDSIDKIIETSRLRYEYGETEYAELKNRFQDLSAEELLRDGAIYHKNYYQDLTHKGKIERAKARFEKGTLAGDVTHIRKKKERSSIFIFSRRHTNITFERRRAESFDKTKSVLCQDAKVDIQLHNVTTENVGSQLIKVGQETDNSSLQARLSNLVASEDPLSAVAYDMKYHLACLVKANREVNKKNKSASSIPVIVRYNKKRSHTQLDSRKQVIAFQDRVMTINIKEAQHPLK